METTMENQALISSIKALLEAQPGTLPQLSPEVLSTLYGMAYQFYRNGKYDEAKQFFRFLTHANTHDRRFWMGLAASLHMLKEHAAAIECYSVAAIQNPDDPYTHWHAAECFFALGNQPEAIIALESALAVARNDEKHYPLVVQLELIKKTWSKTTTRDIPEGICQGNFQGDNQ